MKYNTDLKEKALRLRKIGRSYNEINKSIGVSKATLSLWLSKIKISTKAQIRISNRIRNGRINGGAIKRADKIKRVSDIKTLAKKEVISKIKDPLWLTGAVLYWAEGTKEKSHTKSAPTEFTNSDPGMIKIFLRWLFSACGVSRNEVKFGLYIHENNRYRINTVKEFWSKETGFPIDSFSYVYYKKSIVLTKRKNIGDKYFGNLRVMVTKSTALQRQISGWIEGIVNEL